MHYNLLTLGVPDVSKLIEGDLASPIPEAILWRLDERERAAARATNHGAGDLADRKAYLDSCGNQDSLAPDEEERDLYQQRVECGGVTWLYRQARDTFAAVHSFRSHKAVRTRRKGAWSGSICARLPPST